ncbi:class I SAM-dependent methyltransferase [Desulfovibrio subterraneus]|uniref:class I SAM-dependent methyltransferase n=1 Tax=Desulfovibrio subterraneus TaxID=2718620 RepID=UPI0022B899C7|nr:class I SAM-dependent methyltransferase [Desulfovibrio subterraneus]WBF66274.1 class I SAM-dependent methyltransferase [Desulfovibrio subterraneus]
METLAEKISNSKYSAGAEFERSSKTYTRDILKNILAGKVLDVGCGTGLNAAELQQMGHTVYGIDISPIAIEKFNEAGFTGKVCDLAQGIPFDDESFDTIFASEVIEHVADYPHLLNECNRTLRPGGKLVLSTPNSAFWAYRILGLLGKTVSELQHPGHIRFFTLKMLGEALRDAGFNDITIGARHMYCILPGSFFTRFEKLLVKYGFKKEMRFKTGTHFWQLSRFKEKANGFWADTLIVTASK